MMTAQNPEAISNRNEAIVALKGDELFWMFFQPVKVFEQEGAQVKARTLETDWLLPDKAGALLLPAAISSDGKDKRRCKRMNEKECVCHNVQQRVVHIVLLIEQYTFLV